MNEALVAPKASRIDSELKSMPKAKAGFIEPMLLLRTEALPEGAEWIYELKLDGYRAIDESGRPSFKILQNYGSSKRQSFTTSSIC